jgi:arylsulfatase A-like enzyme
MTGRHPARTRITDWTLHPDVTAQQRTASWLSVASPPWNVRGLQPADTTLPGLLRAAGYRTIHIGKAHFGALGTPGADPTRLGFDVNVAGHAAGAPGSYYSEDEYGNGRDGPWGVPGLSAYYGTDTYLTDALTQEAEKAIEEAVRAERPFFLNMAYYAVHTPIMADSQYVSHYAGADAVEAAYASMVEGYDASLGALLDALGRLGVAERTLILFTSDNGGLSAHTRGVTPLGTSTHQHNLPLRSGKGSAYEGGIRVPMVVAWAQPDTTEPMQQRLPVARGTRTDAPVISHDVFPTILDGARVRVPDEYVLDGKSFAEQLRPSGRRAPSAPAETTHVWHYPHLWGPQGPGLEPFTAIRAGAWKLIYFYNDTRYELYNLADDLGETTDLVRARPEVALRLAEAMRAWMQRVGAQTPVDRSSGVPAPQPPLPR